MQATARQVLEAVPVTSDPPRIWVGKHFYL